MLLNEKEFPQLWSRDKDWAVDAVMELLQQRKQKPIPVNIHSAMVTTGIGPGKHVPDEQVKGKEPVITDEENTLIAKMLGRPEEEITGKKRKPSKAKNNALKIIEEKKNAGIALSRENFTPEEIEALENFQGIGGTKATGSARAVLTEYYTPKSVISKIWQLLAKYISPGSKVLEPSAGTGTFARNPIATIMPWT